MSSPRTIKYKWFKWSFQSHCVWFYFLGKVYWFLKNPFRYHLLLEVSVSLYQTEFEFPFCILFACLYYRTSYYTVIKNGFSCLPFVLAFVSLELLQAIFLSLPPRMVHMLSSLKKKVGGDTEAMSPWHSLPAPINHSLKGWS